jgi:hypothetical protein
MGMTTSNVVPGAPLVLTAAPLTEVVAEFGAFERGDGVRVVLQADQMIFMASAQGTEIEVGIDIMTILEAIGRHNAKVGS